VRTAISRTNKATSYVKESDSDDAFNRFASFSPDGSKIAFVSERDITSEIWVMNSDGSSKIQLTGGEAEDERQNSNPSWSPDGLKLAFDVGFLTHGGWTAYNRDIYVMDAADPT
jgi:Tol biopolymer transport system component